MLPSVADRPRVPTMSRWPIATGASRRARADRLARGSLSPCEPAPHPPMMTSPLPQDRNRRASPRVAILSRGERPVEVRRGLPGDESDVQARYLEADVAGSRVASVYLPNGNPQPGPKFDYKLAWFERLIRHAQTLIDSGVDAVLAGDFNVVPTDADIYNAGSWRFDAVLQPETREKYARLLAQGWVDATRRLHPDERIYTFWVNAEAFARNAGFRMDFVLLTPALAKRLAATGVDRDQRGREKPSDHAPVWIELAAAAGTTSRPLPG